MLRAGIWTAIIAVLAGCASGPPPVEPGRAAVWGSLRLVPRLPETAGVVDGGYADRRYADAARFDYSSPGFAVVYAQDGAARPGVQPHTLRIRAAGGRVWIEPEIGAVRAGGRIEIRNETAQPQVVSAPTLGQVERVEPGGEQLVSAEAPGVLELFVPALDLGARVLVTSGPWTQVDGHGRFALGPLEAGRTRIHAWHPRLPPTSVDVELREGVAHRLDLELGVGVGNDAR